MLKKTEKCHWHLKYTWKSLDIIHLSLSQWHKRKYLRVLVNLLSFCFHDSSLQVLSHLQICDDLILAHTICYTVIHAEVYVLLLCWNIITWFYSIPWLNCMKHFSVETCLHRHSIKHILWQLKDYMSSSTKTSILLSVKTFSNSSDRSPQNKVIWKEIAKITNLFPNKVVQSNLWFCVLTSTLNQTHNL